MLASYNFHNSYSKIKEIQIQKEWVKELDRASLKGRRGYKHSICKVCGLIVMCVDPASMLNTKLFECAIVGCWRPMHDDWCIISLVYNRYQCIPSASLQFKNCPFIIAFTTYTYEIHKFVPISHICNCHTYKNYQN